jgi:isopenicillin N synthase-like dioxygenase
MSIPMVDFSTYDREDSGALNALARRLDEALTSFGFVAVTHIGIDARLRARAFASAHRFFSQPRDEKLRYAYTDPVANFGYQPPLSETLQPGLPADLKEAFTMRDLASHYGQASAWPSADFREVAQEYFDVCLAAAFRLLHVFAVALDAPIDFFVEKHSGENVTMRYLHYPSAGYEVSAAEQMGAGAHTDYGSLTLLFQDQIGGLQLRRADGRWMDVPPVDGAVNINTGDLMCRWSNGRYPSTEHRVLPRIGSGDRYSIAFFADPDNSTLVQCLPGCVSASRPALFADVTAGEHIQRKIDASQSPEAAGLNLPGAGGV